MHQNQNESQASATKNIPIKDLIVDEGIQPRENLKPHVVKRYAEAIENGAKMPPVDVFDTGVSRYVAGGFHRHEAYKQLGKKSVVCRVHQGTYEQAALFAIGDNNHGEPYTNEEKNINVLKVIRGAETSGWTDRRIAAFVGVSHTFVRQIRLTVLETVSNTQPRIGADGRQYQATKPAPAIIPDGPGFDDRDPVDIGTESIPDDAEAPPDDWQSAAEVIAEPEPELDGYGRPVTIPAAATSSEPEPERPATPPATDEPVTIDERIARIPLYQALQQHGHIGRIFFDQAELWFETEKIFALAHAKLSRVRFATGPVSDALRTLGGIPSPERWEGCASCKGTTRVGERADPCPQCKGGFTVHRNQGVSADVVTAAATPAA